MDEPFSALDTITRARVQELAAELLRVAPRSSSPMTRWRPAG